MAIAATQPATSESSTHMKASVDKSLCIGCGLCPEICPMVFQMENDQAVAKAETVPPEAEEACREAAQDCPVEAIKIEE
jgi:ferredoxin